MTGQQWQTVKAIAADARGLSGAARQALIASRCADDEGLRREVESAVRGAPRCPVRLDSLD